MLQVVQPCWARPCHSASLPLQTHSEWPGSQDCGLWGGCDATHQLRARCHGAVPPGQAALPAPTWPQSQRSCSTHGHHAQLSVPQKPQPGVVEVLCLWEGWVVGALCQEPRSRSHRGRGTCCRWHCVLHAAPYLVVNITRLQSQSGVLCGNAARRGYVHKLENSTNMAETSAVPALINTAHLMGESRATTSCSLVHVLVHTGSATHFSSRRNLNPAPSGSTQSRTR